MHPEGHASERISRSTYDDLLWLACFSKFNFSNSSSMRNWSQPSCGRPQSRSQPSSIILSTPWSQLGPPPNWGCCLIWSKSSHESQWAITVRGGGNQGPWEPWIKSLPYSLASQIRCYSYLKNQAHNRCIVCWALRSSSPFKKRNICPNSRHAHSIFLMSGMDL